MPTYCYICETCGKTAEHSRPMSRRNEPVACDCNGPMVRDYAAERGVGKNSGDLPDWVSVNAGVLPHQVAEANRAYGDLGVKFDSKGNAHVPGKSRKEFLKRRGLTDVSYRYSRYPK